MLLISPEFPIRAPSDRLWFGQENSQSSSERVLQICGEQRGRAGPSYDAQPEVLRRDRPQRVVEEEEGDRVAGVTTQREGHQREREGSGRRGRLGRKAWRKGQHLIVGFRFRFRG